GIKALSAQRWRDDMFVGHVKVYVRGDDGGDGMVAFRREKYVPNGGPAGGEGGKGANVVFEVEEGLRTLMDFRYKRIFKADRGTHGMSANKHGAKAEDMIIKVPPGTVVKDADTGETRSEEHTSELQSREKLVCRLLLEKKQHK